MISNRYLFILGAGSSVGYGYPTGKDIISRIIENLENHIAALEELPKGKNYQQELFDKYTSEAKPFINALKETMPKNIDGFLSRRKGEFDQIGNFAIALAIINAERRSGKDNFPSYLNSKDNWQRYFFERICEGYNKSDTSDLNAPPIGIISFNYDRSLECAFYHYLKTNYGSTRPEDALRILDVKHAYGSIRADWNALEYGKEYTFPEVHLSARQLEIMYEGRSSISQKVGFYEDWIRRFERIFFLGFAYDDFNLQNLHFPAILKGKGGHIAYGTAKDLDDYVLNNVKSRFKMDNIDIDLSDCYCLEFIKKHI